MERNNLHAYSEASRFWAFLRIIYWMEHSGEFLESFGCVTGYGNGLEIVSLGWIGKA